MKHPFHPAILLGIALALPALTLSATSARAQGGASYAMPYTLVETGQRFNRLQEAINAIGNASGTIRIAPGNWQDCGVQAGGRITYTAAAPGQTVLSRQTCEGKAGLVLRGRAARIDGLIFSDFRVDDGNGAGIRLEKGDLTVSQSWFKDSEEGILTADDPRGTITIDKSTFTHLGRCDRGLSCAHSVYTGHYGQVIVTRSRFEAGSGGHYLKSRAARVMVENNSFDDTAGHSTNYMIDLPAGSTGIIAGNWFVQGRDKENWSTFIAIAAEAHEQSADGLTIRNNVARFVPGLDRRSAFVADWSGDRLVIGENQLAPRIARFQKR